MGLKVTTIARLPENAGRVFFAFGRGCGWDDDPAWTNMGARR